MAWTKYIYTGGNPERRAEYIEVIENFKLLVQGPALVKDDWKSTVITVEISGKAFYCKRFNHGSILGRIKNQLRRSKAKSSYCAAERAVAIGIPVPERLAAIEKRAFGLLIESFLMTRAVEGALPLQRFIKQEFPRKMKSINLSYKHRFIRELAEFVAMVHKKGVVHNDLKGTNIIVVATGDYFGFHVLDLDGVSFRNKVPISAIIKNLVQLNNDCMYVAGEKDRLRFFLHYLHAMGMELSRDEKRSLVEKIVCLTRKKVDKWFREKNRLEKKGKSKHTDESMNLNG